MKRVRFILTAVAGVFAAAAARIQAAAAPKPVLANAYIDGVELVTTNPLLLVLSATNPHLEYKFVGPDNGWHHYSGSAAHSPHFEVAEESNMAFGWQLDSGARYGLRCTRKSTFADLEINIPPGASPRRIGVKALAWAGSPDSLPSVFSKYFTFG